MSTWTYGGTALNSFGQVTLIDDYLDLPDMRGDNQLVPFRHGRIFKVKYYEQRSMVFNIAIKKSSRLLLETALDDLKKLLAKRNEQTLAVTMEDSTVRQVSAKVEKSLQIKRESGTFLYAIVEFNLAFPFLRLSTAIADNTTTINANPKAMTVNNPGTVEECYATIILTGPLQNTVITNSTNGFVLTYTGTIASPRVVTISISATGEVVATDDLGANKISNITHSGGPEIMKFEPGNNSLSIADGTATTGTVKVTFNAPFI